jgi:predicted permease
MANETPRRIRAIFHLGLRRSKDVRVEVDDEIAFHLQERVDALVGRGWTEADAVVEARRLFEGSDAARPSLVAAASIRNRRLDWFEQLDSVIGDLRLAARQLRHAPTFAFGVIMAIALGIGANATMFSTIDRLLLRPPAGVAAPDRVYTFARAGRDRFSSAMSYVALSAIRTELASVATVSAETFFTLPVAFGGDVRSEHVLFADADYSRVVGARPALGRFFVSDDFRAPNGAPVVVISYGLWQRELGGEPGAIGRELTVDDQRLTIIGVAPRDFNGVEGVALEPFDLWLPITLSPKFTFALPNWQTSRQRSVFPIARLNPGVDPSLVAQRATTVQRALERTLPKGDTTIAIELRSILPSRAPALSPEARIASMLGAVSLIVLIIACFNAANLMLARAVRREREIAIRVALGVSRRRLVRQLMIDSLLLSALGAVVAIAIAAGGAVTMRRVLLNGVLWSGNLVDARTLAFIAVAALVAALLTCVFPALLLLGRLDVGRALAGSSARQAGRSHRTRFISLLVVTQGVLSTLLLIGALLFVHSLGSVRRIPLGMDAEHTTIAMLNARSTRESSPGADALFTELAARASRIPGVLSVAIAEGAPFTVQQVRQIAVPGLSPELDAIQNGTLLRAVSPNYFETIGTRIVRGRGFSTGDDRDDGEPLAIVNVSMAAMLWPNGDAIGKCIQVAATEPAKASCRRIVGIADDVRQDVTNMDRRELASIYVPLTQGGKLARSRAVIVRADGSQAFARYLRAAAGGGGFAIPMGSIFSIQSKLALQLRPWQLGATMFGVFGALAFVLCALGTYSMFAYNVAQRTQEMGVRIALGARTADILSLIGRRGATLSLIGVVVATAGAAALAPLVQPLLFQTSARSGPIYAIVAVAMIVVAIGASLVPAWRGARVDPLTAIRSE